MALDFIRSFSPQSANKTSTHVPLNDSKQTNEDGATSSLDRWSISQDLQSESSDTQHDSGASLPLEKVDEITLNKSSKSSKTIPASPDETPVHCTTNCLFGRTAESRGRKMLRCCVCMQWFHFKCVQEDPKTVGIWSCYNCRNMPQMIQNINTQLQILMSTTSPSSDKSNNDACFSELLLDMKSQLANMYKEQKSLRKTNEDLLNRLEILTREKTELEGKLREVQKKIPTVAAPNKSLLIGNSLLRNVKSKDENKLKITCSSGATFDSITSDLTATNEKYDKIIIVSGITDCRNKDATTATISQSTNKLLNTAKKLCKKLIFSSVLPCKDVDNTNIQMKIDHVNDNMERLCRENRDCHFIDNSGSFKLADMSVNDALFVTDGIHPNTRGAQKFISNLQLADLATVQRPPRRSQQLYNYGGTTDSYRYRNQIPNSTTMRCTWCRESDHTSVNCTRRGNRCCYQCRAADHQVRNCPWLGCPWNG